PGTAAGPLLPRRSADRGRVRGPDRARGATRAALRARGEPAVSDAVLEPWRPGASGWDRAAAQHLHPRAGVGATPEELERSLSDGFEATLERFFADRAAPELRASMQPLLAAGELELLQAWWMALILEGGAPLRERMTLHWHGHFATSNVKVDDVR